MPGLATPFKDPLVLNIKKALRGTDISQEFRQEQAEAASAADEELDKQANAIADAVETYVNARLGVLAAQLKLPSAFVGAGASGPVTIAPASFAGYDPTRT